MENKLLETIAKYESLTFNNMEYYSQFTIDTIERLSEDFAEWEADELEEEAVDIETLIGSFEYNISNIIEVLKEGKDKELFEALLEDLKNIPET